MTNRGTMHDFDVDTPTGTPSLGMRNLDGFAPPSVPGAHVVVSELVVAEEGIESLEAAFRARLGEVDSFPGHLGLQVWRDDRHRGRYVMVTWWETADAFAQYMRSDSHRRSHARIPSEPARPRAVRVDRFSMVTD
jgi:heme-degrading monooxygenase HmoA